MSDDPSLHLSHHGRELEPSAFHQQLRRLESLQTLMAQGATVVNEVAQFMIKVRAELSDFEREQALFLEAQQHAEAEQLQVRIRIEELEKTRELNALRVAELENLIVQLQQELAKRADSVPREELESLRAASDGKIASAAGRIAELETALLREREARHAVLKQARHDEALAHAAEITALKSRLSAAEHQLALERERRARLMEVVKTHEVRIAPPREPEAAG